MIFAKMNLANLKQSKTMAFRRYNWSYIYITPINGRKYMDFPGVVTPKSGVMSPYL